MAIDLICFPYAGGNKNSYMTYLKNNNFKLNLITLEYPGRGARISEGLKQDMNSIVYDAYNQLMKLDIDRPYAIYGHSMGALVGYLVIKEILENNNNPPVHLFFSGRQAPSIENNEDISNLSSEQLRSKLKEFGGSHDSILQDQDLMNFYEPIIRADFKALSSYEYKISKPLNIPITLMYGDKDNISHNEIGDWQKETFFNIETIQFEGNHFFIFNKPYEIMETIGSTLYK